MAQLVILSDCTDVAINEIRLEIQKHLTPAELIGLTIEPAVRIFPWSVLNGSFLVRLIGESVPPGAVLFVVLNPLAAPAERLAGQCSRKDITFIGRNTGVFGWLAKDLGLTKLIEIDASPYVPFGGKRLYSKAVAAALRGELFLASDSLLPFSKLNDVDRSEGKVLHIDNFGIMKLSGAAARFSKAGFKPGSRFSVSINDKVRFHARYVNQLTAGLDGEWVIYDGSSLGGLPELAQVRENGAQHLGIKIGDTVTFLPVHQHR